MTRRQVLATAPALFIPVDRSAEPIAVSPACNARSITSRPANTGIVGVSALHIESGEHIALRSAERFPLQSVYKLPIAIRFLQSVDRGEQRLDDPVELSVSDQRPGFSPLAGLIARGPVHTTAGELLERVLVESDNTASDRLLKLAGGPRAVTRCLQRLGLTGIMVSRQEGQIALDYYGVTRPPPESQWSLDMFERLSTSAPESQRKESAARYAADPRDTATPDALTALLVRVHRRDLLSAGSSERLVTLMRGCSRAPQRIKGLLPSDTVVAHRPGTGPTTAGVNACTNDIGLITLPLQAGHIALAILVKGSDREPALIERTIAQIARAAYDHWL